MNEKKIEIGDLVDIYFSGGDTIFNATILYQPYAPGDCFKVFQEVTETAYNVQHYESMTLVKKGNQQ